MYVHICFEKQYMSCIFVYNIHNYIKIGSSAHSVTEIETKNVLWKNNHWNTKTFVGTILGK